MSGGARFGPGREFELIRKLLDQGRSGGAGPVPAAPGPTHATIGPGDDAAVFGNGYVLTCDLTVEGVHFRRDWMSWEDVGWRAAAACVSDVAAMAAEPVGVVVSMALPRAAAGDLAPPIQRGVTALLAHTGGQVLGGDLSGSPGPVMLDLAGVGWAAAPALRSHARQGDGLWVTGVLGAAATAVRVWEGGGEPSDGLAQTFRRPTPRVAEARWLAERGALHALIDLSDGLLGDAAHIAAASSVAVVLDADRVPIHPELLAAADVSPGAALNVALRGGEDYELCFTAAPGFEDELADAFTERFGLPVSRVGRVEVGDGVRVERRGAVLGEYSGGGGFDHFTERDADA